MEPLLECRNVGYSYHSPEGETKALRNIDFKIYPGEFAAVVGPSGCGKSTLLSLICGILQPEEGEIRICPRETQKAEDSGCVRPTIGYMLQKDYLLEWRSVYRNAILGLELQRKINHETEKKVRDMLKNYNLEAFSEKRPSSLSGGMRQRAALIRTLALEPELLLLDEPFSALDYQTRLEVAEDMGNIIRKEGKTALLVTHDLSEAISLADRVIVLSDRPAEVKKIVPIIFEEEEQGGKLSSLMRRRDSRFPVYFQEIWKEIRNHD